MAENADIFVDKFKKELEKTKKTFDVGIPTSPGDLAKAWTLGSLKEMFGENNVTKAAEFGRTAMDKTTQFVSDYGQDTIGVLGTGVAAKVGAHVTSTAATQGVVAGAKTLGGEVLARTATRYMPWAVAGAFAYEAEQTRTNFSEIQKLCDERERFMLELYEKYQDELASGKKFATIITNSENAEDYKKFQELNERITNLSGRNTKSMLSSAILTEGLGESFENIQADWELRYGTAGYIAGGGLRAIGAISDFVTEDLIGKATKKAYHFFNYIVGRDTTIDNILAENPNKYRSGVDTAKEFNEMFEDLVEARIANSMQVSSSKGVYTPKQVSSEDLKIVANSSSDLLSPVNKFGKNVIAFVLGPKETARTYSEAELAALENIDKKAQGRRTIGTQDVTFGEKKMDMSNADVTDLKNPLSSTRTSMI